MAIKALGLLVLSFKLVLLLTWFVIRVVFRRRLIEGSVRKAVRDELG